MNDKNPTNRNSIPKIIISNYDKTGIKELKIRDKKLSKLIKISILEYSIEKGKIVFKKIKINDSDEIEINANKIKIENKEFYIDAKIGIKNRYKFYYKRKKGIKISKETKKEKYSYCVIKDETDGEYYRYKTVNGEAVKIEKYETYKGYEKIDEKIMPQAVTVFLRDESGKEITKTERNLLDEKTIKVYQRILGKEEVELDSREIYKIKRFLDYRSEMLFYYSFINNFFIKSASKSIKSYSNNIELTNLLKEDKNLREDIKKNAFNLFTAILNQEIRENLLKKYDKDKILNDFEKLVQIFEELRQRLMHFDYEYFDDIFYKNDLAGKLSIHFLNQIISNEKDLNINKKIDHIENKKIDFYGEKYSLSKIAKLYNSYSINKLGFNKFINSLLTKDGEEVKELKEYFNELGERKKMEFLGDEIYHNDIHSYRNYKEKYKKHKDYVAELQILTKNIENNSKIYGKNENIRKKKKEMLEIIKLNKQNYLELKYRLAFGLMIKKYGSLKIFRDNFEKDLKVGNINFTIDEIKNAIENTYIDNEDIKEKLSLEFEMEKKSLKSLVKGSSGLKLIMLILCFIPRELKGEFLGFINRYNYETKHIERDSISNDNEIDIKFSLKLKILKRNINKLNIFDYSFGKEIKFANQESGIKEYFLERQNSRILKKLKISHNQEEFEIKLQTGIFKYYSIIFKLLNDLELMTLLNYRKDKSLMEIIEEDDDIKKNGNYNFRKLMEKIGLDEESQILKLRNMIAHLNYKEIIEDFIKAELKQDREKMIIEIKELIKEFDLKLGYDFINDFIMKMIQLKKKIESNNEGSKEKHLNIKELIINKQGSPNDFYTAYKMQGYKQINIYLKNQIGDTTEEKNIEREIKRGMKKLSTVNRVKRALDRQKRKR